MSKELREQVCNALTGCPGCHVPYHTPLNIYAESSMERHSEDYARYLNCKVCGVTQCHYDHGDLKFTLRPPQ